MTHFRLLVRLPRLIASAIVLLGLAGCFGPVGPVSVEQEDPTLKIPAIKRAVANRDRSVIPQLVQDLDNNDPAVRFYAFQGLQRLTGQDFGYRYMDEDLARQEAIERWRNWLISEGLATP